MGSLWRPEKSIAAIPFRIYAQRLPERWFTPSDWLSSAPMLLLEKLESHAIEEEYVEMKEDLRA